MTGLGAKLEVVEINYTRQFSDRHMSGIAKLKNLKRFEVDYCEEISEASLSVLHFLPQLEVIRLRNCAAVFSLEALADCRRLKKVDLSYNEHLDFKVLASLIRLENLECLVLENNSSLEDDHLKVLQQFPRLKSLDLADCQSVTDAGLVHLGDLNLTELNLSGCSKINGAGFAEFKSLTLESLVLNSCRIDDAGLLNLARFSGLKKMDLESNQAIRGTGLSVLGNFRRLEFANLAGLPVDNDHLRLMAGVTTIKELNLNNCSGVSGRGLIGLVDSQNLEKLELQGCFRLDSPSDFEPIGKLAGLKFLDISQTRIRPESVFHLPSLTQLEYLDLSECKWIDDLAVQRIAEIKSLKILRLGELPRLTDQAIRELHALPNLEILYLSGSRLISGDGFSAFGSDSKLSALTLASLPNLSAAGLKNLPSITTVTSLTISAVPLSNEHLTALRGLPNVAYLELDDLSGVSENANLTLRASLPKLK